MSTGLILCCEHLSPFLKHRKVHCPQDLNLLWLKFSSNCKSLITQNKGFLTQGSDINNIRKLLNKKMGEMYQPTDGFITSTHQHQVLYLSNSLSTIFYNTKCYNAFYSKRLMSLLKDRLGDVSADSFIFKLFSKHFSEGGNKKKSISNTVFENPQVAYCCLTLLLLLANIYKMLF